MSAPILVVEGLRLTRGARTILDNVSLEAARGEIVAVMGPSGSGKTTLLRVIAGLDGFDAGRIVVDGLGLESAKAVSNRARKVGMVFQFHCLFEHLSALENVCLAPVHAHGIPRSDAERRGRELLRTFGVEHRAAALPRHLSGGEAQRVAIARALAVDPPLLLMDEPTASLDPERRNELGALVRQLTIEGRTLLIATHDEDFARSWATRILRLREGVVL